MAIDRLRAGLAAARAQWQSIERDWRSVAVGAAIVTVTVALDLQIPW
ncbi:hypothetical protein SAMN05444422_101571 [Halobiforma haloterrestris]|uniref:Uncharacterized protein n=1 Tax=Natronobacterium haloterrestre TaxID=148448 RepID=A0A1I1DG70_NATHA|nr:hypothetical protein [Halobiforma haloterrestris]SFB73372.1 hypothetical protein SAMN05444422_101571 [Halobiforma haloterrestris]